MREEDRTASLLREAERSQTLEIWRDKVDEDLGEWFTPKQLDILRRERQRALTAERSAADWETVARDRGERLKDLGDQIDRLKSEKRAQEGTTEP